MLYFLCHRMSEEKPGWEIKRPWFKSRLTSCVTLASCFAMLNFSYVNSNGTNFVLTLFQALNEITLIKPLAKFTKHRKQPINVNSFIFDGDGINIITTNKSRQSKRLILACWLTGEIKNMEKDQWWITGLVPWTAALIGRRVQSQEWRVLSANISHP